MEPRRGQALVEFAVVLPLIVLVILGGLGVGLVLLNRMDLQSAAYEAAISGAQSSCSQVPARTAQLLEYVPDEVDCTTTGQVVEVRIAHSFPTLLPWLPQRIEVDARATIRDKGSIAPSPS